MWSKSVASSFLSLHLIITSHHIISLIASLLHLKWIIFPSNKTRISVPLPYSANLKQYTYKCSDINYWDSPLTLSFPSFKSNGSNCNIIRFFYHNIYFIYLSRSMYADTLSKVSKYLLQIKYMNQLIIVSQFYF